MKRGLVNIFLLLLIGCFFGCGRRQKNIFNFSENKDDFHINKLILPCVKGIKVEKVAQGNNICWQPIPSNQNDFFIFPQDGEFLKKYKIEHLGYNVYCLVNSLFIPKKSLNKKIITTTEFIHKKTFIEQSKDDCKKEYLVNAVFKVNNKIFEGPSSQIVSVN